MCRPVASVVLGRNCEGRCLFAWRYLGCTQQLCCPYMAILALGVHSHTLRESSIVPARRHCQLGTCVANSGFGGAQVCVQRADWLGRDPLKVAPKPLTSRELPLHLSSGAIPDAAGCVRGAIGRLIQGRAEFPQRCSRSAWQGLATSSNATPSDVESLHKLAPPSLYSAIRDGYPANVCAAVRAAAETASPPTSRDAQDEGSSCDRALNTLVPTAALAIAAAPPSALFHLRARLAARLYARARAQLELTTPQSVCRPSQDLP